MHKYVNRYDRVTDYRNIYSAYRKACKGKRYRPDVLQFTAFLEENLLTLLKALQEHTWPPGEYSFKTIYEPKKRKICIAPFADRIVHHAACNIIGPIFERTFIYDSYACRHGKGTHKALDRLTQFLRAVPAGYALKGDIHKYFPSISHGLIMRELEWKVADGEILWLCQSIVDSFRDEIDIPGTIELKGIPIGNLTSQWFANIVGNVLDQYVKHDLHARRYLRYMDDFIIVAEDKRYLWDVLGKIKTFLASIGLVLNGKSTVMPVRHGIPFLGFIVFTDHRAVCADRVRNARQRLRKQAGAVRAGRLDYEQFVHGGRAWFAHLRHADTYGLRARVRAEMRQILGIGKENKDANSISDE